VAAGVLAGLLAMHPLPSTNAAVGASRAVETVTVVDRTHKGDRLYTSPAPDAHAIGRMALRHLLERARSRLLRETCEPPASPFVDPQLAKLPGRCLT